MKYTNVSDTGGDDDDHNEHAANLPAVLKSREQPTCDRLRVCVERVDASSFLGREATIAKQYKWNNENSTRAFLFINFVEPDDDKMTMNDS